MEIKEEYEPEICAPDFVFETINFPPPARNIAIWSNEETKQLVDLYKSLISQVGPLGRFKRKKDMWFEISSQIPTKNFKQCEERFKTLMRRKKKDIEKVYISDAKRKLLELENGEENELTIIRKRRIDCDLSSCTTPFNEFQVWSNSETKLLTDLYKHFISEVGPQKKFIHKKDMWSAISANFQNKDAKQCEQRYNTVLRRKQAGVTKVYISKARRKTLDFRPRHIAENKLKRNRVRTPEHNIRKELYTQQTTSTNTDNKDDLTISETLLRIAAKREEGKERRHREKMQAIEKLQTILERILDSKK